jgi:serine/threonine-protein kinase
VVQSSAVKRGNLGRYALYGEIASGGMATVHLARFLGPVGFARTCAIKRLHPHLAKDPDFVAMFLEEARLAARVRNPHVVSTLDVVAEDGELFLVMEYVAGESVARLIRKAREKGERVPPRAAVGILCGTLEGLHAAHHAVSERNQPLGLVHRDISPQNVHVGVDGVARVLDFGIAKATNSVQVTRTDQIKGKIAYMSPEQLAKRSIDGRADVYSASVVLWETLTGQRLFQAEDVPALVYMIMSERVDPPSARVAGLPPGLDEVVMKGLARDPDARWSSAREMALALEAVIDPAPPREIGAWVEAIAGEALEWRKDLVREIESETASSLPPARPVESSARQGDVASGIVATRGELHEAVPTRAALDSSLDETREMPARRDGPAPAEGDARADASRSRLGLVVGLGVGVVLIAAGVLAASGRAPWEESAAEPGAGESVPAPEPTPAAEQAIGIAARRTPQNATSAQPADCDPPFTVDARGVRRAKPQCVKK